MTEKLLNILQTKTALLVFCLLVATVLLILPKQKDTANAQWAGAWDQAYNFYAPTWGWENTQTASTAKGEITQQNQITQNGNACVFTAYLNWRTQNVRTAQITVSQNNGQDQTFATGANGSQMAPWLYAGSNYKFTLWDMSFGNPQWLDDIWIMAPSNNCGQSVMGTQYWEGQPTSSASWYNPTTSQDNSWYRTSVSWTQDKPLLISPQNGTNNQQNSWNNWIDSRPLLINTPENVRARDRWGWVWN